MKGSVFENDGGLHESSFGMVCPGEEVCKNGLSVLVCLIGVYQEGFFENISPAGTLFREYSPIQS